MSNFHFLATSFPLGPESVSCEHQAAVISTVSDPSFKFSVTSSVLWDVPSTDSVLWDVSGTASVLWDVPGTGSVL